MKFLQISLFCWGIYGLFLSPLSHAQDESSASIQDEASLSESSEEGLRDKKGRIEKMEVTGSHIKQIDIEGAMPVQVLDRKYLEQTGYNSVGDVLRDLSANTFGSQREHSGSSLAGVAHVSLRGLGANRTLVLLNGKRLARDGISNSPDLNLIAMQAVERIDVLKDSSSATYGSDALGGVVNIITRKNFSGAELNIRQEVSEFNGGNKQTVGGTVGWSDSRTNIITSLQYRNNEEVFSRDRMWSKDGESSRTPTPNVDVGDGPVPLAHCPPNQRNPKSGRCIFNYANYSTALPKIEQVNLLSSARFQVHNSTEVSLQASGTLKKTDWVYAPGAHLLRGLQGSFIDSLKLPGHTPGTPVDAHWRSLAFGNRVSEVKTNAFGLNVGVKHLLGESWEIDASVGTERIKRDDRSPIGYSRKKELVEAIESGKCNIFQVGGKCEAKDGLHYEPYEITKSRLDFGEIRGSGEIYDLPSGSISMAVGLQTSFESFSDDYDPLSLVGGVAGGGAGSKGSGARRAYAVFSEFAVPIREDLDVQMAGRYDRYSDFGDTFNPKASMVYRPTKKLLLRTSLGTGFKAPNMTDLYSASSAGYPTFVDHVSCARAMAALDPADRGDKTKKPYQCEPRQYFVRSGGNDGLEEERSRSFNVGAVYQVSKELSMGIDVFDIKMENLVGMSFEEMTRAELNNVDLSQHRTSIMRNVLGEIEEVNTQLQNLSQTELRGIDFNLTFSKYLPGKGELTLSSDTSYLLKYDSEGFPGAGYKSVLGKPSSPRWKNNIGIEYGPKDDLRFITQIKTVGSHEMADEDFEDRKRYTSVDAHISYRLRYAALNGTLVAGAKNILTGSKTFFGSPTPPLDHSNINNKLDSSLYDNIGRRFFIGYSQTF